jgi:hypothetical protein
VVRYVEHDRKRRQSTIRDYRNSVNAYLGPEFGDEPLEAIDPDRIDRCRSRTRSRRASATWTDLA